MLCSIAICRRIGDVAILRQASPAMISTAELSNGNGRSAKHGSVANLASFHAKFNGSITQPVVADFCSGMGGLSLAAQQLGMQIVAGVDLNAAALRTFKKNFPAAEAIEGSVR